MSRADRSKVPSTRMIDRKNFQGQIRFSESLRFKVQDYSLVFRDS